MLEQQSLLVLALVGLASWLVVSHRIFGPTVSMRRHVQSLLAGDYTSRIQPRAGDEFHELTQELNHLAEKLSEGPKKN